MSAATPFAAVNPEAGQTPDGLADAVLASLSRTRWGYLRRPWGFLKTGLVAVATAGLMPLLVWPRRFASAAVVDEQQLWHLAEWMRLRTGRSEWADLRDHARQLRSITAFRAIYIAIAAIALLAAVRLGAQSRGDWILVWQSACGLVNHGRFARFGGLWMGLLSFGYVLHWFDVGRHAARVDLFVRRFNELVAGEGVRPVKVAATGWGFDPVWTVAALVAAFLGAIWAIPLSMAGVVHRRYVWVTMRQMRGDLARRVRVMLLQHRPPLEVRQARCVNSQCRAFLKAGAAFCPRCGARAPAEQ